MTDLRLTEAPSQQMLARNEWPNFDSSPYYES